MASTKKPKTPKSAENPKSPAKPKAPKSAAADDEEGASQRECADYGTNQSAKADHPGRAYGFLGFDKMMAPEAKGKSPEQLMRWMYLASNLRFAGIYLQGAPPSSGTVRKETDIANDRGWMAIATNLDAEGWGLCPVYFGPNNKYPAVGTAMDAALGKAHAQHAKSILAGMTLGAGFDLSGAVVYIDNEDQEKVQMYGKTPECRLYDDELPTYLDYYKAFAQELATADEKGRAYRFGIYSRPSFLRKLIGVVPTAYVWQVFYPAVDWDELQLKKETLQLGAPGAKDPTRWAPRLQLGPGDRKTWPAVRQFQLDLKVPKDTGIPASDRSIDLDSCFGGDPSDPVASPRLAAFPGTTMVARLRMFMARYDKGLADWESATLKEVRRGSLRIFDAATGALDVATVDQPIVSPSSELHPDAPIATAADGQGRLYVAAFRRDRGVVVGEVVRGGQRPMELVPSTPFLCRRPMAMGLTAMDDTIIVVVSPRSGPLWVWSKPWPTGTWSFATAGVGVPTHPLAAVTATAHPKGTRMLIFSIGPNGAPFAATGPLDALTVRAVVPGAATLPPTSALASISPTPHDDLVFGIAEDGRLLMFFETRDSSDVTLKTDVEYSVKKLFVHSRLGVTRESDDRVHVAGIDLDGEVRCWPVRRAGDKWAMEDSAVIGKGAATAPNPWSDVALSASSATQGIAAVAGAEPSDGDPETRTRAFVTSMFKEDEWTAIAGSKE